MYEVEYWNKQVNWAGQFQIVRGKISLAFNEVVKDYLAHNIVKTKEKE